MLKVLISAGTGWLERHYEEVNVLNVFPVPDGDTGTNMMLTLRNAYQAIELDDSASVGHIARRVQYGAIMGSRGNSGTILSQIFAGFASALDENAATFDIQAAAKGLRYASDHAYRAVQNPVEGTLLTVISDIADEAHNTAADTDNLVTLMECIVARGWQSVRRTPDLLPILRQAGVVDSGGMGLVYFLEGMLKHLQGERHAPSVTVESAKPSTQVDVSALDGEVYNYDVQFLIHGEDLPVATIRRDIEAMGDSGVIVGDATLVKVHIHVDDPGIPISYGVKHGTLHDVVVENMQAQFEALQLASKPSFKPVEPGEIAVIAVAPGDGLASVFAELGAAGIVTGGQGNNPSTQEIITVAQATGTDKVIVLPNNRNIILAAEQAAQHSNSVKIAVVPTTSVPQGIAAMLDYQPGGKLKAIAQQMQSAYQHVTTGEITRATRAAHLNGLNIEVGQIIGLVDNDLRAAGENIAEVVQTLLVGVNLADAEVVTLYYGADVSAPNAGKLANDLREAFPDLEFELVDGGQPHYFYILGIE